MEEKGNNETQENQEMVTDDSHPDEGNEETSISASIGLNGTSSVAFVLAKMKAIVSGAQSAVISKTKELLLDRRVDIADRKEALLNANEETSMSTENCSKSSITRRGLI